MAQTKRGYEVRDYPTRTDVFRRSEGLTVEAWADAAGITRNTLYRMRAGMHVPRSDTLAALVRAASRLLHRSVKASEVYDLEEDAPLAATRASLAAKGPTQVRRVSTRFDRFLAEQTIAPKHLAAATGISRQTIGKMRNETISPSVRTVATIVRRLRSLGYDVKASDIVDVGE